MVKTSAKNSCLPVHSPRSVSSIGLSRNSYHASAPEHTTTATIRIALTIGASRTTSDTTRRAAATQKTTFTTRTTDSTPHHHLLPDVSSPTMQPQRGAGDITQM